MGDSEDDEKILKVKPYGYFGSKKAAPKKPAAKKAAPKKPAAKKAAPKKK